MTTVLPVERPDFVFDADRTLTKLGLILAAFPEESQDVLGLIVPFKREVYEALVAEFRGSTTATPSTLKV